MTSVLKITMPRCAHDYTTMVVIAIIYQPVINRFSDFVSDHNLLAYNKIIVGHVHKEVLKYVTLIS